MGLGFRRTIGAKNKLAVSFEFESYYQTAVQIDAMGTGLLEATAKDEYDLEGDFGETMSSYKWLPVLRFGIIYKLCEFE